MKKYGIIGALLIVAAVAVSYFFDFPAESIVSISAASFGLAGLVIGAYKASKAANIKTVPALVCIILSVAGGVLCVIGGASEAVFAQIAGATVALLSIIFGIVMNTKK